MTCIGTGNCREVRLSLVHISTLFRTPRWRVVTRVMSLDLYLFRSDQGGDPDSMRDVQKKRFKDVTHVDKVVEMDTQWRKCKF